MCMYVRYSAPLWDIVRGMFCFNPQERLTAAQALTRFTRLDEQQQRIQEELIQRKEVELAYQGEKMGWGGMEWNECMDVNIMSLTFHHVTQVSYLAMTALHIPLHIHLRFPLSLALLFLLLNLLS